MASGDIPDRDDENGVWGVRFSLMGGKTEGYHGMNSVRYCRAVKGKLCPLDTICWFESIDTMKDFWKCDVDEPLVNNYGKPGWAPAPTYRKYIHEIGTECFGEQIGAACHGHSPRTNADRRYFTQDAFICQLLTFGEGPCAGLDQGKEGYRVALIRFQQICPCFSYPLGKISRFCAWVGGRRGHHWTLAVWHIK